MRILYAILIAVIAAALTTGPVMAQGYAGHTPRDNTTGAAKTPTEREACMEKCESGSSYCQKRCGGMGMGDRFERDHCLFSCSRKYDECRKDCRAR
jgi:hypothetical protein